MTQCWIKGQDRRFFICHIKNLKKTPAIDVLSVKREDRGSQMDAHRADKNNGRLSRAAQMEAIVAEHETALLRYATRIVNCPDTAQDVVQNVFIKLFNAWREGTHPSNKLKGWLYRVTHNEAIDFIRRESRLRLLHEREAAEHAPACSDGRHCAMGDAERREIVLRHVKRLDERERQALLLRLEEGLSYREISEVTGRTEGNVGNILHHAVRKLSKSLKAEGVTATP